MSQLEPILVAERRPQPEGNKPLEYLWSIEDDLRQRVTAAVRALIATHGISNVDWRHENISVRLTTICGLRYIDVEAIVKINRDVVKVGGQ